MMLKYSVFLMLILSIAPGAAGDTDPVAVLQSAASIEEKAEACRLISISGGVDAIPVLEPLLADEKLSHMARYALEPMPGQEADAALRRALPTVSGRLKAGIITSLGVRGDAEAVPEIIPCLEDEHGLVAEAAARALGRIATPEGIAALENALAQPDLNHDFVQALGDGLLAGADTILADGRRAEAARLYDRVRAVETLPVHVRAAALQGAMLSRKPENGRTLLIEAVQDDDRVVFTTALRIAPEIRGKRKTSSALAAILSDLSPARKECVIWLLGELGDARTAGAALVKEAEAGSVPVRVAALQAATRLGYAPVLEVMTTLVASDESVLAEAARDGLSYFPGQKGDAAVKNMLQSDDAITRHIAVELISRGALPRPVEVLMKTARDDADESVRLAALKGARDYAGSEQMAGFLTHLLEARSADEMEAAEEGLKLLCMREKDTPDAALDVVVVPLREALDGSDGRERLAIMRVLASTGSPKAFDAVLPLASADEEEVRTAAVRAICDWPAFLALTTLMEWVKTAPDNATKAMALRGAVRLLAPGQDAPEALNEHYATLLAGAASPEEKKLLLSGLSKLSHPSALTMALEHVGNDAVKAEAVQAAIAIAEQLGTSKEELEALEHAKTLIPELRGAEGE